MTKNLRPDGEAAPVADLRPGGQEPVVVPDVGPIKRKYRASIFSGPGRPLAPEIAESVRELEASFGMPMWLLLQGGPSEHDHRDLLHEGTMASFHGARKDLPRGQKIGLIVDSRGGSARGAYQLARFLQRRCGGFTALVPRLAKSAATLLVLGADELYMGENAEIGPLDAQIWDPDREVRQSALDETQSLDVLQAWALSTFDQLMFVLVGRTGKKAESTIPHALRWITDMMRPLLESIDVVHYTQMSRTLREAEEYAVRLLTGRYTPDEAKEIARYLVVQYPEHGFVIGPDEAETIGLRPSKPSADQIETLGRLWDNVSGVIAMGKVQDEETNDGA